MITQTVEGRDRFPVRVRYARDYREDEESVKRLLVSRGKPERPAASAAMPDIAPPTTTGPSDDPHNVAPGHEAGSAPLQIPLSEVADVRMVEGPAEIKSENGQLVAYVALNVSGDRDVVGFVDEAQRAVAERVKLPAGVHIEWSGEFENQVRAAQTLRIVLPAVFALIFIILYLTYKDLADAALMMLAVPEALAGGVFFQFLFPKIQAFDWNAAPTPFTVAVWVGYIAAFGMATETGIIMLVYLREAIDKRGGLEGIRSLEELREAVIDGAVHRLRPKLLTEGVAIVALAPMLFATGVGSRGHLGDGAAGAGRAADRGRGGGHFLAGALLLGPPGALAEVAGREGGAADGGGRGAACGAGGSPRRGVTTMPVWVWELSGVRFRTTPARGERANAVVARLPTSKSEGRAKKIHAVSS